jgi:hypothetical protein
MAASADSPCPSCGRMTGTTASGACAECWQAKSSSGRDVLRRRPPKTEPLFDFNLDVFELVPGWAWWALGGGAVVAVAFVVRSLVG